MDEDILLIEERVSCKGAYLVQERTRIWNLVKTLWRIYLVYSLKNRGKISKDLEGNHERNPKKLE